MKNQFKKRSLTIVDALSTDAVNDRNIEKTKGFRAFWRLLTIVDSISIKEKLPLVSTSTIVNDRLKAAPLLANDR